MSSVAAPPRVREVDRSSREKDAFRRLLGYQACMYMGYQACVAQRARVCERAEREGGRERETRQEVRKRKVVERSWGNLEEAMALRLAVWVCVCVCGGAGTRSPRLMRGRCGGFVGDVWGTCVCVGRGGGGRGEGGAFSAGGCVRGVCVRRPAVGGCWTDLARFLRRGGLVEQRADRIPKRVARVALCEVEHSRALKRRASGIVSHCTHQSAPSKAWGIRGACPSTQSQHTVPDTVPAHSHSTQSQTQSQHTVTAHSPSTQSQHTATAPSKTWGLSGA